MAHLIYSSIASLDGYVADESGNFEWSAPDLEVHGFLNSREREIGTYLYGRRIYEVMTAWEHPEAIPDSLTVSDDYARIWQAAEKIVYSTTLDAASTAKTRIERAFDPEAVWQMKASAGRDLSVGGATLAAEALRAGLVDECQLYVVPIIVGGGLRWLPNGLNLRLALLDERRFESGVVYLRYGVAE